MHRHTKGPWEVVWRVNRRGQVMAPTIIGPYCIDPNVKAPVAVLSAMGPETEGNAHLIAAAPELLSICKDILRECGNTMPSDVRDRLRRVIKRADGYYGD